MRRRRRSGWADDLHGAHGEQATVPVLPLRNHIEQNFHVGHRLERYGAGHCMDYSASPPEVIAETIAHELGRKVTSRPVETDGAARAAAMIAESL